MSTVYTAGIHPAIPMAEYLADPCPSPSLSSGCAYRLINESPLHAWHSHPRLGARERDDSNAADKGTTAHDLLLGGEGKICEINPRDYPSKEGAIPIGWTNGAIRTARDEARANGLTPMLTGELIGVRAMVKAAREFVASSEIAGVFDAGECEMTVIAQEGDTYLRTRPDWLNLRAGISLSYKTTQASVHADSFSRIADSMGYWFSLEFYRRVLRRATGKDVRHVILAQEQSFPYACALYELSPVKAELERSEVERAINVWRMCMRESKWPGYGRHVQVIEPRPWELIGETEVEFAEEHSHA